VWGERGPRMRDRKARTFGSRWADTRNVVISSNVPLRQDGLPHASRAGKRYDDPRVTVYFSLKSRALSMARDRYYTPWENIRSLILAINATRSTERHGDNTMMERAFSGFAAIAPPAWQAGASGRGWSASGRSSATLSRSETSGRAISM